MSLILGLSGKKCSGKNTSFNWMLGQQMVGLGLVDWARINNKGQLVVPAVVNNDIVDGILDAENPKTQEYLAKVVWPFLRPYSFATPLKQFCMEVFGLTYEQCYGSNTNKETLTQLRWVDMPDFHMDNDPPQMTARAVMQYFGTNVCRRMLDNCWVDATIRRIQKDKPQLAVITDVRFPNEVEGIQKAGGKVVRFLRAPFAVDEHPSEIALDNYEGFDAVLDNREMSIPEQNAAMNTIMVGWGYHTWDFEVH